MRRIELPCYGIKIAISDQYGGTITSDLYEGAVVATNPAAHAIEAMILAHACAGIDVEGFAYIEGIKTAVEACENNL